MKTVRTLKGKVPKDRGPKDIIDSFRKRFAKSLKHISIEEINELKSLGRR